MRQNIKAKETYYDGYRFRSRLEARWAVFFNNIGLEYEYKMEGFNMKQYLIFYSMPYLFTDVLGSKVRYLQLLELKSVSNFAGG